MTRVVFLGSWVLVSLLSSLLASNAYAQRRPCSLALKFSTAIGIGVSSLFAIQPAGAGGEVVKHKPAPRISKEEELEGIVSSDTPGDEIWNSIKFSASHKSPEAAFQMISEKFVLSDYDSVEFQNEFLYGIHPHDSNFSILNNDFTKVDLTPNVFGSDTSIDVLATLREIWIRMDPVEKQNISHQGQEFYEKKVLPIK